MTARPAVPCALLAALACAAAAAAAPESPAHIVAAATALAIEATGRPARELEVAPLGFTVDTVPPRAPPAPALSRYSDSGAVGDGFTTYRNLNFTGTSGPAFERSESCLNALSD